MNPPGKTIGVRRVLIFAGLFVLLLGALWLGLPRDPRPKLAIELVAHEPWGSSVGGRLKFINTGDAPLRLSALSQGSTLIAEVNGNWRSIDYNDFELFEIHSVLFAGSNQVAAFRLPQGTTRWMLRREVRVASQLEAATGPNRRRLPNPLDKIWRKLLSDEPGPAFRFSSEIFEVPTFGMLKPATNMTTPLAQEILPTFLSAPSQ
jgi:hypothetical protein